MMSFSFCRDVKRQQRTQKKGLNVLSVSGRSKGKLICDDMERSMMLKLIFVKFVTKSFVGRELFHTTKKITLEVPSNALVVAKCVPQPQNLRNTKWFTLKIAVMNANFATKHSKLFLT